MKWVPPNESGGIPFWWIAWRHPPYVKPVIRKEREMIVVCMVNEKEDGCRIIGGIGYRLGRFLQ